MPHRITVGISSYRNRGHLENLLQSIRQYTFRDDPEFDIVVCDDGTRSVDHPSAQKQYESTVDACTKFGATLIEHSMNYGIPTAWNHLAESLEGKSEIMIILNDDLTMPPDWIKTMVHFLDTNKDNPHVGSAYWLPVQPVDLEMQRLLNPRLGHTLFRFTDQVTGKDIVSKHPSDWGIPSTQNVGDDHGLGRVPAPACVQIPTEYSRRYRTGEFYRQHLFLGCRSWFCNWGVLPRFAFMPMPSELPAIWAVRNRMQRWFVLPNFAGYSHVFGYHAVRQNFPFLGVIHRGDQASVSGHKCRP